VKISVLSPPLQNYKKAKIQKPKKNKKNKIAKKKLKDISCACLFNDSNVISKPSFFVMLVQSCAI